MKKLNIALLILTCFIFSCNSASMQGFSLKGQLKNEPAGTKAHLEELTYTTRNAIDSTTLDASGNFSLKGIIKNNGLYQLRIGDKAAIFLVLDEKTNEVKVNADTADINNFSYKISGSPGSEQLRDFILHTKTYGEGFAKAMQEYNQNVTDSTADSIRQIYQSKVMMADSAFRLYATHYVDTTKNPIVAIFAVTNLDYQHDAAAYEKLADRLRSNYAQLPFVQAYLQMLSEQKAQAPQSQEGPKFDKGAMAPDISLQDATGKTRTLSSLRGSIVLLDFWASWCGPCRRENPNVVKAYQAYKNKGFTVFSVSLDTDKDKWLEGIKKDNLSWPNHVSDLQGWQSSVCELYGIRAIPQNYLLDKDGKIIASDLRGDDLMTALQALLP